MRVTSRPSSSMWSYQDNTKRRETAILVTVNLDHFVHGWSCGLRPIQYPGGDSKHQSGDKNKNHVLKMW